MKITKDSAYDWQEMENLIFPDKKQPLGKYISSERVTAKIPELEQLK